jgi:hypothetical protein
VSRRVPGILRRIRDTRGWKSRTTAARASFAPLLLAAGILALSAGVGTARAQEPAHAAPDEPSADALFSLDSPIGPIEYQLGRGMRFGWTGLNLGAFTTFEIEKVPDENGVFSVDSVNILTLWQPVQEIRFFMELEIGGLYEVDMKTGVDNTLPTVNFQRLYGEYGLNDALNFRLGKSQTPVGRWNLVPAEPFTWTATDPLIVEGFDEHSTGPMLHGSFFPSKGVLSYWLYSQLAAFDEEGDELPADHNVGGRLEYSADLDTWSLGSSFLASKLGNRWGYTAGLDGQLVWGPLELTTEFIYLWGDLENPFRWDIYLQGVLEVLPKLYLVGRYEHAGAIGSIPALNLGDIGLNWRPVPYLTLKATYRFADEPSEEGVEGFKASFSVVF